ncbi:TnsA-like heteromeric transposase endonuclease subunit [Micromonospora zamorensis]|uniref:TnsA-like heteromeric transposase endonuclease subunit n=1 Tax=Micromonospora zamorensis TaxID=709883 RepID=A0ABZ1PHI7_9ACTN
MAFEDVEPVRRFGWSKGQSHFAGWWWSATTGRHVAYESWLERDHAMLLDFDPDVVAIASQPFWLCWSDGARARRHAPDFFVRRADGVGVVIDVRADDRIESADEEAFEATGRACAEVGWDFRRLGVPAPVMTGNVRWLSRYRHPRCAGRPELASALRQACEKPRPLFEVASEIGERIAVLPVLFHLMWRRVLVADLGGEPLHAASMVTASVPE